MSEASNRSQHSLPPESQYQQQQQQPQHDPRSRRQGAPADPNWQPALSSIPDDGDLFDEAAYGLGPPPCEIFIGLQRVLGSLILSYIRTICCSQPNPMQ